MKRFFVSVLLVASVGAFAAELSETQRNTIAFEALSRLHSADIETNSDLKVVVYKLLEKVRGTDKFFEIVKQFQLKDCDPGLLEMAGKDPSGETGVEAMRLVLS